MIKRLLLLAAFVGWASAPALAQAVAPSPQSISAGSSGTSDCVRASNCAYWNIQAINSVTLQITGTATSMTLTFEGTADGQTWFSVLMVKASDGTFSTTTTSTGQFIIPNTGFVGLRVRCSTYSSGAVNAYLTRGYATSATRLFDLSHVSGVLAAANGGTGQSSYAVGDMLYASGATALSKLADVAAGSYLRSGGVTTAPVWSTLTLPNSSTTGDILYASSANTTANLADVAVGQVLASGGASTAPAYTANPAVTSLTVTAGTGTGTAKACGTIKTLQTVTATSGTSAQDLVTYTTPANTLANNGERLHVFMTWTHAGNTNSVSYWPKIFGTVGTGATSTVSAAQLSSDIWIVRLTSSTAAYNGRTQSGASGATESGLITGLDFTSGSNNTIIQRGQSASQAGDISTQSMSVEWCPAN